MNENDISMCKRTFAAGKTYPLCCPMCGKLSTCTIDLDHHKDSLIFVFNCCGATAEMPVDEFAKCEPGSLLKYIRTIDGKTLKEVRTGTRKSVNKLQEMATIRKAMREAAKR